MSDKSKNPQYIISTDTIGELSDGEKQDLKAVSEKFVFRSNTYYQSLIDWDDPNDPIRQLIIPSKRELQPWGKLDASDESLYQPVPGLEHKYRETALLLVNDVCGAYCRFCFRKRLFMADNDEVVRDVTQGLAYIREHPEISNVLLTGGDPLMMPTSALEPILAKLREIDHVQIIRIGTKMPAFNPYRVINFPDLCEAFARHSTDQKKIYIMAHFTHPRELTDVAIEGINKLLQAGVVVVNQCPIIAGVNDSVATMAELFKKLSYIGVPPYYTFQCRPTLGNKPFVVPVERSYAIFREAQTKCSGLAKRAKFVMSHKTGKVEICGMDDEKIYMKYHQAADSKDFDRMLVFARNSEANWFDDYID